LNIPDVDNLASYFKKKEDKNKREVQLYKSAISEKEEKLPQK